MLLSAEMIRQLCSAQPCNPRRLFGGIVLLCVGLGSRMRVKLKLVQVSGIACMGYHA